MNAMTAAPAEQDTRQDGGVHGPAFDIDAPVAVQGCHDGIYLLVVPPLKARDSIRIARRLAKGGFADPAWAATFITQVRSSNAPATSTVLRLTVPMNAEPGVRPGHTTVHVGRDMSYDQSCRLAHALGALVDCRQATVSKQRREWRVRPGVRPASSTAQVLTAA